MKNTLRSLTAAAAVALTIASPAKAEIFFQDTYISVRDYLGDKQPGSESAVNEQALRVDYANAWTYGSNFVSIDFEQFGAGDKQSPNQYNSNGISTSASAELYSVWRTTFSANAISGTKNFAFGPISDVGFTLGFDWANQNDAVGIYKRFFVAGPTISIAVPKGFWSVSVFATREFTANGFDHSTGVNFNTAPMFFTTWLYPISIGPVDTKFTGYGAIIGPKGTGNPDNPGTGTEIHFYPKYLVDAGKLLGMKPGQIDAGVGYEYWYNKFGLVHSHFPGTEQHAVTFEVGYHF